MKKLKHFLLFFSMFFVIYSLSCLILIPKGPDDVGAKTYFEGRGYVAEKDHTIEIVALGNSDLYSGFIPMELYQQYGYTAFGTGISKGTTEDSYRFLKEIDTKQDIKICILEADLIYDKKASLSLLRKFMKMQIVVAPFIYHSRWKDLKLRDFTTLPSKKNRHDFLKGYQIDTNRYPYKIRNYMGNEDAKLIPISRKTMHYLNKIRSYCAHKNIQLLFVNFPSPFSWNYGKHNGVQAYADKYNIPYIDYNVTPERFQFDFKSEFRDNGNHLNIYGARKATLDIAKELEKYNILTDYKTKNDLWAKDLELYLKQLKKYNVHFEDVT